MKIEKSKYQGYLWYSDQTRPQVLHDEEFELDIPDNQNPFIIEGQLYDGERSISIKYIDGKYVEKRYVLAEFDGVECSERSFFANQMAGYKLKFRQYWRPQADPLCEDMEVLQAAEQVFTGLEKTNEKQM